jgi:hypothetical protein
MLNCDTCDSLVLTFRFVEGWLFKLTRGKGVRLRKNWARQYFMLERNVLSFCR